MTESSSSPGAMSNGGDSESPQSGVTLCISSHCSFHQIRRSFEEKGKTLHSSVSQRQVLIPQVKASLVSDFQKNYPAFKCCFTKRQFAAMENCFNLFDENYDGFLEPKEIKKMLNDHKQSVNLCDADVIVSLGDKNRDGKLCPNEFLELCRPAAEAIREELFQQGNPFLSDKDYVQAILQKVRSRVNPIHKNVKSTRQYFENISCGGTGGGENVVSVTSTSAIVVNQYLNESK